jgi:hypothetical protein
VLPLQVFFEGGLLLDGSRPIPTDALAIAKAMVTVGIDGVLDRPEVIEPLGKGAFGGVSLVQINGQLYALKESVSELSVCYTLLVIESCVDIGASP